MLLWVCLWFFCIVYLKYKQEVFAVTNDLLPWLWLSHLLAFETHFEFGISQETLKNNFLHLNEIIIINIDKNEIE